MKDKTGQVEEEILNKLREPRQQNAPPRAMQPLGEPIARDLLVRDLNNCELMLDTAEDRPDKGLCVYRGIGAEIPNLLLELGRLREETFRTVGEGSGLARDNDSFDAYYDQFIGWDKAKQEITGAYRIGRIDRILKERGPAGVYTGTLFHLENLFATDFSEGTLEAGRSFVRPEYQRGATLLVIWMSLGRFIAAHPEYRYLMGPVSISSEFKENSKHLMVRYLMKYHPHEKADLARPRNPPVFDSNLSPEDLTALVDAALDFKSLQEFVRQAEGNPRAQIPQLIKLYLELGVRFLAFNQDDDFNSVDGLIWLDIPSIPPEILVKYMGEDGLKTYTAFHLK
jgi:putative hemolysin